jgi:hypothetical protein
MRQPELNIKRARGFLLIVAILVVLVVAIAIAALGNMTSADIRASTAQAQSVQAFYLTESGMEVEQRRWAQNLSWYRSTSDPNPNPATAQTLGTGTFTVYTNLPATLLKASVSAAAATIGVYSTDRFPASGTLQIEEDLAAGAEFVTYTGISAILGVPTFTGVTRGQTVGTVLGTDCPCQHPRSDAVYPVTTLLTALTNTSCSTIPAPFQIAYHPKFLTAGTLDIEGEEISYTGSSVAGGNMTLTGVTRCAGLLGPLAHPAGRPVTPVLIGGDSADYQIEMVSTGTVGGNIRYARKTAQR